jgi:hypothetical protein
MSISGMSAIMRSLKRPNASVVPGKKPAFVGMEVSVSGSHA